MSATDDRDESQAERDDRNFMELLQELRVAGLGVQVLFGFLLSLPFTTRFTRLDHAQRALYITDLLLAALSTALLLAPVAYHRVVFRQHLKAPLVRAANIMAIAGLAAVGLSVTLAVLLVIAFVGGGGPAVFVGIFVGCLFAVLWFAIPLVRRQRGPAARGAGPSDATRSRTGHNMHR
jgi:hypothetical protein